MKVIRVGLAAVLAAVFGVLVQTVPAKAQNFSDGELKCTKAVGKNFAKLQSTILKLPTACLADDISGEADSTSACETLSAELADKVTQAKEKFVAGVAKACHNTCKSADIDCISDLSCPAAHQASPAHNNLADTNSNKGSINLFNLDWPGPYCESVLGHSLRDPSDLGTCLSSLAGGASGAI